MSCHSASIHHFPSGAWSLLSSTVTLHIIHSPHKEILVTLSATSKPHQQVWVTNGADTGGKRTTSTQSTEHLSGRVSYLPNEWRTGNLENNICCYNYCCSSVPSPPTIHTEVKFRLPQRAIQSKNLDCFMFAKRGRSKIGFLSYAAN